MGCGCLGKFIGFWLGVVFVCLIPVTVWSVNLNRELLKAETYLAPFDKHNVYENITPLILPALAENPDPNAASRNVLQIGELDFLSVIKNMEASDWEFIAIEVIPPDFLQEETEKNLPILFDYMNGKRIRFDVEFQTGILQSNLLGQSGDRMISLIYDTWESCDESTEAQTAAFFAGETTVFPYCKPQSSELQRQVFTLLKTTKDEFAADIPPVWNVRQQYAERNNATLAQTDDFYYRAMQRPSVFAQELYLLNFLIPSALLALIMIFAVDSAKSFFRWMGLPLIFTGIFVLIPLGIVPVIVSAQIGNTDPQTSLAQADAIQKETFRGILLSWVTVVTTPILLQGAGLVALGFLLMFVAVLIPDEDDEIITTYDPYQVRYQPMTSGSYASQPTQSFSASSPPPWKAQVKAETTPKGEKSVARVTRLSINLEDDELDK